ncbi:hypothetical protein C1645_761088 [Glomus cerebriforme]|uniref:Zinc-binding domain-containing protein n=1 Tax=Glomus cerebriforme TaxID=658196 RepID=A0A397T6X1_9GLOM|nr:hypothetical protein C1645_761088 [Glomus cerebriforme]
MLSPQNRQDFFMRPCKDCNKKSLVSSFFLYKQEPNYSNIEPTVEIICHLEWNNHYRVFAQWKCQRPRDPKHHQHEWRSSYTWVSLGNFIDKTPAKDLNKKNFYMQKCHECREECEDKNKHKKHRGCKKCNHDSIILNYDQLVQSAGGKPHKRWLCAKCKGGAICTRTDNNYRVPRVRKIKLF